MYSTKRDKKRHAEKTKEVTDELQRVLKVKGMMCEHCEARVKKALEALPQVESAEPDFKTGTVEVVLKTAAENEVLKKTVENEGYKVLVIK